MKQSGKSDLGETLRLGWRLPRSLHRAVFRDAGAGAGAWRSTPRWSKRLHWYTCSGSDPGRQPPLERVDDRGDQTEEDSETGTQIRTAKLIRIHVRMQFMHPFFSMQNLHEIHSHVCHLYLYCINTMPDGVCDVYLKHLKCSTSY